MEIVTQKFSIYSLEILPSGRDCVLDILPDDTITYGGIFYLRCAKERIGERIMEGGSRVSLSSHNDIISISRHYRVSYAEIDQWPDVRSVTITETERRTTLSIKWIKLCQRAVEQRYIASHHIHTVSQSIGNLAVFYDYFRI